MATKATDTPLLVSGDREVSFPSGGAAHGQTSTRDNTTRANNSTWWNSRTTRQDGIWQRILKGFTSPASCGSGLPSLQSNELGCETQPQGKSGHWDSCPAETSVTGWLPLRVCNLSSCVRKACSAKPGICQKMVNYLSLWLMLKPHEDFFGRKMKHCKAFSSKAFKAVKLFN